MIFAQQLPVLVETLLKQVILSSSPGALCRSLQDGPQRPCAVWQVWSQLPPRGGPGQAHEEGARAQGADSAEQIQM